MKTCHHQHQTRRKYLRFLASMLLLGLNTIITPVSLAQPGNPAELTGANGFMLRGLALLDHSGTAVSSAGDINGDGLGDLVIGAEEAGPGGILAAGECYIVFGRRTQPGPLLELSSLNGTNGFTARGLTPSARLCSSVSAVGDMNNDGIDDIALGARGANNNAGATYVIFGRTGAFPANLDLGGLDGTDGFVVNGIDVSDFSAISLGGAGDVNGDGADDLIIGAYWADPGGRSMAGESYVVFGRNGSFPSSLQLSTLDGSNGFVIEGVDADDLAGFAVDGAGDINADGIDDVIVGAYFADPGGTSGAGEAYVVFGSSGGFPASIEAGMLDGSNGFVFAGNAVADGAGFAVSGLGDVNGDGIDDVAASAPTSDPLGRPGAGESYVIFGSSTGFAASLGAADLNGNNGTSFLGRDNSDLSGSSIGAAGDINGDGVGDLIIGARQAGPGVAIQFGESYVVYGASGGFGTAEFDLALLNGLTGREFRASEIGDDLGRSVSGVGDFNGDGLDDYLMGAPRANPDGSETGESYLVFGSALGSTTVGLPPAGAVGDNFGSAVDIDSNLLVVGMPGSDVTATNTGAVAIYRVEGGQAVFDQLLEIPAQYAASGFGASVAVSGDTLVVGTSGTPPQKGTASVLAAAIYQRSSQSGFTFKQPLTSSVADDDFGTSVSIDANRVVVGAPADDAGESPGLGSGAAYVFERPDLASGFGPPVKIKPPSPDPGARFGQAVATRGNKLLIGAPMAKNENQAASGSASLYRALAGAVAQVGTVRGSQSNAGSRFGAAVDLARDGGLIVGAPDEDGLQGAGQGAAYRFNQAGDTLTQIDRIQPADSAAGSRFGASVAMDRGAVAVGAPLAQNEGGGSGAVYRFDVRSGPAVQLDRNGASDSESGLGSAVSLYQDKLVAGAPESISATGGAVLILDPRRIFAADFEN